MRWIAALAFLAAAPAQGAPPVVAPMHSDGEVARFPRIVKFSDARVTARANALLAAREAEERKARDDCRADGGKDYDYDADIEVAYVSSRYVGMRLRSNFYCGGAHPDGNTEGITIDLATGARVDWQEIFKPGFLPEGDAYRPGPSALRALYQARYRKDGNDDPQCRDAVANGFTADFVLSLDAHDGLVAEPTFAHVIQACGDGIGFKAAELAPFAADAGFIADLKATVRK